jgi:hypothetical protein
MLGFSRKNGFSCFWLVVFAHDGNGNKEEHRWRFDGVYNVEVFMSFSFIWDEYATMDIIGR